MSQERHSQKESPDRRGSKKIPRRYRETSGTNAIQTPRGMDMYHMLGLPRHRATQTRTSCPYCSTQTSYLGPQKDQVLFATHENEMLPTMGTRSLPLGVSDHTIRVHRRRSNTTMEMSSLSEPYFRSVIANPKPNLITSFLTLRLWTFRCHITFRLTDTQVLFSYGVLFLYTLW